MFKPARTQLADIGGVRRRRAIILGACVAMSAVSLSALPAAAQTWKNPNNGNWSLGTNWTGNVAPVSSNTTTLTFNATAGQSYTATQDIANQFAVNSISLNPAAVSTINLSGLTISFGGASPAMTMSGAGTVGIANPLLLTADTTLAGAGAGTIVLGGAMSSSPAPSGAAGPMLTKTSAGNLVFTGGATLYAMRLNTGNTAFVGGSYNLISTERGNDAFGGTDDGGFVALAVGAAGSSASLSVSAGATVSAVNAFAGNDAGSTGTIAISGLGTSLVATRLGTNYGSGTVAISGGANATASFVQLGRQVGSSGNLTVDGNGSTLNANMSFDAPLTGPSSSFIRVGGGGIINVNNANANIGFATDLLGTIKPSTVTLNVSGSGSQFNVNGNGVNSGILTLAIGDTSVAAAGTLNVTSGGLLHTQGAFFGRAGGVATASIGGNNANFTNDGEFSMGSTIASSVTVSAAGRWTNGGNVFTSVNSTDNAIITVTGPASLIDFSGAPQVQFSGGGSASGGATTVNVASGGELRSSTTLLGTAATIHVGSGVTPATLRATDLTVNGTINFNSGTLNASGLLAVANTVRLSSAARNAFGTPSNKKTLEAGALSFSGSGFVDLNDNDAILKTNTLTQVEGFIRTGRNNGAWNGTQLVSTAAKNNLAATTGLGAISGTQYTSNGTTTFNGRAVAGSDVLVKYTYNGDTDLNGKVDGADYSRVDTAFNNQTLNGGWYNGDFDYSGDVDGADYAMIDTAFNGQGVIVLGRGATGDGATELLAGPDAGRAIEPLGLPDDGLPRSIGLAVPQINIDALRPGGLGAAQVVPEPGVTSIVGVALLAVVRRRRRAL